MNKEKMEAILAKIKEYDRIMLFRHIRNDGDCVGATKGLQEILRLTYPQKEIHLIDSEQSEHLAFLGPVDPDVPDELYADALGIVLDTGNTDRISNKKYTLCKELIKIDHHIPIAPYGDLSWVEEERSSTCEMVAEFYQAFRDELKINQTAATYLFTGMVTDSGRFRFRSVTGDTLRAAGTLLDQGVDTDMLYAQLYLEDYSFLKFKAHVYEKMEMTEHGVAYIYIDRAMQERFGLTLESASAAVSFMDSIKGCLSWIAFIENGDGSIRVRLRSRFVPINSVAEQFRGGGHDCAAGATLYSPEEMGQLLEQTDGLVKHYKDTHEDWL